MTKKNAVKDNSKKSKRKVTVKLPVNSNSKNNFKASKVKRIMEIESFNLGEILREARIIKNLTQEELAKKSGTTKYYISRIENNGSDIRLKTLMKIVQKGLEGNLKFSVDFDD